MKVREHLCGVSFFPWVHDQNQVIRLLEQATLSDLTGSDFFLSFCKNIFIKLVCVCVCVYAGAFGAQKHWIPMELLHATLYWELN